MTERYAYLGPEGTFTEAAFRTLKVHGDAEPVPYPTIQAALAAVRSGAADRAVVPIESSVEGVVTTTVDDLTTGGDLLIRAEAPPPRGRPAPRWAAPRSPSRSAAAGWPGTCPTPSGSRPPPTPRRPGWCRKARSTPRWRARSPPPATASRCSPPTSTTAPTRSPGSWWWARRPRWPHPPAPTGPRWPRSWPTITRARG